MNNSNEQNIADIVEQLQQLQLQQSTLLAELARLNPRNTERGAPDDTASAPRALKVGDRVIINNPGRFQPSKGVIIRIGDSQITVKANNGTKIQRSPNNLILDPSY